MSRSDRRRRLLVVSYYFPPTPSVGGVRMYGLARYLGRHGWEATVVTPARAGRADMPGPVIETADADMAASLKRRLGLEPDLGLRDQVLESTDAGSLRSRVRERGIDFLKAATAIPDPNRGWIAHATRACDKALGPGKYDAVLTSSPPASAHYVGRAVKRRHAVPWIADLRDLWADDPYSSAPGWRRSLDRRIEKRTLASADGIVTVSEPIARRLRELHPGVPVRTILNGFDPELPEPAPPLTRSFSLTYTGSFYQGRRDPAALFAALAELIEQGRIERRRVEVRLFSKQEPWLRERVARYGLEDVVEIRPWVGREQALAAQRESQILLLPMWSGTEDAGVYTGKVFEYLAARRPILMIGGGRAGVLAELLRETGAGVQVDGEAAIGRQLAAWWDEFERRGEVPFEGGEERVRRYSHDRMAGEFAGLLDSVLAGGG